MSEENICEEVMNEEVTFEETMSAEGPEVGSEMLGKSRDKEIKKTLDEIYNFIDGPHNCDAIYLEEQVTRYIQYLTDAYQYVDSKSQGPEKPPAEQALLRNIEYALGELTIMSNENIAAICKSGLAKGESVIQKVREFLDRNIEEEKRKDKQAYYDTCDNYARLCEGLADEMEQQYRLIADDAGIIAKIDEQIKTLRQYSKDLNARRF